MSLDTQKAEQFADRFVHALNGGALCLMASIGHRTGLFDTMADAPPVTSAELAARSGLDERYVREWLGAMVAASVVTCDPEQGTYSLPPEHAASLTRNAAEGNIAVFAQYIGVLGRVEDAIVECFRSGGGIPYERFERFHEVMAEDSGQSVLPVVDTHILPLVPGLPARLEEGIRVLDIGCGRGRAVNKMAKLYPRSTFMGIDLSKEAVAFAQEEAAGKGASNARFEVQDLSTFDRDAKPDTYDLVTAFDAIHDQAKPKQVLRGIHRTLTPGGVFLMQDIRGSGHHHQDADHPLGPLLYTLSCMHCMTVSLAQQGEGLGAMWGEPKAREYLRDAGFTDVVTHQLEHDLQNNFYVAHKS